MNLKEAIRSAPYESQLAYARELERCRLAWPTATKQDRLTMCYTTQTWVSPEEIMTAENPFDKQRL